MYNLIRSRWRKKKKEREKRTWTARQWCAVKVTWEEAKVIRATTSVCLKNPSILHTQKNYFFYFIPSFLQNIHINLSIIHTFFVKTIFSSLFSIISHLSPPNPSFFLIHNTLLSLWLYQFSAFLSSPSFFFFFFFFWFLFLFLFWESFSFLFFFYNLIFMLLL